MFSCLSNYFYSKESLIKICKKAVILCIVLTDDERNDEEVETPNAKVQDGKIRILINDVWEYDIDIEKYKQKRRHNAKN